MRSIQVWTVRRIVQFYVVLLFTLFPCALFFDYSRVLFSKYATYIVLTVAMLFMAAFLCISRRQRLPALSISGKLLGIYFVICIVSAFCSPYLTVVGNAGGPILLVGEGRGTGLLLLLLYLLTCVAAAEFARCTRGLVLAVGTVLFILSAISVVQLCGVNLLWLYPTSVYSGWYGEFLATIGNIDFLSGYLCIVLCITGIGAVVLTMRRGWRALLLCAVGIGLTVLLETGVSAGRLAVLAAGGVCIPPLLCIRRYSRRTLVLLCVCFAAIAVSSVWQIEQQSAQGGTELSLVYTPVTSTALVLLVAAAVLWGLAGKHGFRFRPKRMLICIYLAEMAVLLGSMCWLAFGYDPGGKSGLAAEIASFLQGAVSDISGSRRIAIWKYAWRIVERFPLLGSGPGSFMRAFGELAGAEYSMLSDKIVDFAHNEYLQVLCETGVVGLISFLAFLGSLAVRTIRWIRYNPRIWIPAAAVLCYCVQLFFSFNLIVIAPMFWAVLGLLDAELRAAYRKIPAKKSAGHGGVLRSRTWCIRKIQNAYIISNYRL